MDVEILHVGPPFKQGNTLWLDVNKDDGQLPPAGPSSASERSSDP